MEAEYGRFFLSNYHCAPPMWPAAFLVVETKVQDRCRHRPSAGGEASGAGLDLEDPAGAAGSSAPSATVRPRFSEAGLAGTGPGAALSRANATAAKRGIASSASIPGLGPLPTIPASASLSSRSSPAWHPFPADAEALLQRRGSRSFKDIDAQVQEGLDRFFADERCWEYVRREVSRTMRLRTTARLAAVPLPGKKTRFHVQVPKPYPGVQYRRSKDLNDKHPLYAKHGSKVVGEVEEDGEWVRVRGGSLYLPLRIGPVQILQPLWASTDREAANGAEDAAGDASDDVAELEASASITGPQTTESVVGGHRLCPCNAADGSTLSEGMVPGPGGNPQTAIAFFAR
mmetsp:Transcript_23772/g.74040  ORF Transcript_23772/g.74040 Transcript_23772/m.74040 type:complete len:344 (-) Transcript_23772:64-1095(-)